MTTQVEKVARQAKILQQPGTQFENDAMNYQEHLEATTVFIRNIVNRGKALYE